jgi:hypothetical protein
MYREGGAFAVIIPSDGVINIKESFGTLARLGLSFVCRARPPSCGGQLTRRD